MVGTALGSFRNKLGNVVLPSFCFACQDGRVVTLERQEEAAKMAAENWASSPHVGKIESRVGEAQALLQALASQGESFDLVFLDVDKPGYFALYQTLMETGLLRVGGLLAVDNTM